MDLSISFSKRISNKARTFLATSCPKQNLRSTLLPDYNSNFWIAQKYDDESIIVHHAKEMIFFLCLSKLGEINNGLVKCESKNTTKFETNRAMINQIESSKYELLGDDINLLSNYLVASHVPIKLPRDVTHLLQDKKKLFRNQ